jgi:MFS family permease
MILCFGELVAFWLNYGFNFLKIDGWWRIPLAIQVLPAVILGVGCWFWVPPSPRWLASQDRHECAREILTRLHGSEVAELEMQEIQSSIELEHTVSEASWKDMFMAPVLRVTMLGMAVQFFQQITGTNSILYYTVSCLIRHVSEEANLDSHLYLNAVASGILKQPTSPLGV